MAIPQRPVPPVSFMIDMYPPSPHPAPQLFLIRQYFLVSIGPLGQHVVGNFLTPRLEHPDESPWYGQTTRSPVQDALLV